MTADDFVSAIDGLTFDDRGRTLTLEVEEVESTGPDAFMITVCVPEAEIEMYFDASRKRRVAAATLRDQVVRLARDVVNGRQRSGLRMNI
jgi:hypothetical protein